MIGLRATLSFSDWRLRPGPSVMAIRDRAADFSTATTELWLPVDRA
jgi:AraC family transcriptional regulator